MYERGHASRGHAALRTLLGSVVATDLAVSHRRTDPVTGRPMPANQNFAKRTGECMKDVKPEHGKVRMHARARTHLHSLHPCAPPHASAAARLSAHSTGVHRWPPSWHWWCLPHLRPYPSPLIPRPSPSKACVSLDDYFNRRATMKATMKSSSFLSNYLPTEKPSGIFTSASCEARNRPQSAAPSSRRVGFQ